MKPRSGDCANGVLFALSSPVCGRQTATCQCQLVGSPLPQQGKAARATQPMARLLPFVFHTALFRLLRYVKWQIRNHLITCYKCSTVENTENTEIELSRVHLNRLHMNSFLIQFEDALGKMNYPNLSWVQLVYLHIPYCFN